MPVNQSLASTSDHVFMSAFIVYLVAWVISIAYYVQVRALIEARQELTAEVREPVLATGGEGDAPAEESPVLPEKVQAKERRAEKIAGMMQAVIWLGVILHIVSAVLRGLAVHRFPFGNLYEYVLVISAFAMAGAAAVLVQKKEWATLWPWLLTPVLALLFFAEVRLYTVAAPVMPALKSFWLPIHVTTVAVGAAIGLISGVASLLYLFRMAQPQGKEKGFFGAVAKPLPSAKTLDALAYRSGIVAVPVFGLGIVLGALWAEQSWGRYWGWDPKETVALITWVLYAAYLHARATAGWRAIWAAWINVAAFAVMVFNLFFINMVVTSLHSYAGVN
ncbi:c-type cytochrome biogenesis protein CcsB [Corynebacterium uropygiale]|uniref:C-type cytochrome biogenesis protein CcsB n=1 Tax=Corynebacterium uropygiale TaxID=1775911 RepID=A0A9X1QQD6_9CORY|nr:c-type cytochrome biogenesis protein CcsB [Corynebacterium uropygiale]MCF4005833.1 c-type cytochrome biogenesis protein CcsB [Corynebacterium uropygiale]